MSKVPPPTPVWLQLTPSVIGAFAIIVAGLVAFFATTRIESWKWFRLQRMQAYERYGRQLWKQFNTIQQNKDWTDDDRDAFLEMKDRIDLVGSRKMRALVKSQELVLAQALTSSVDHIKATQSCIEKFHDQARVDLRSWWSFK